MSYRGCLKLFKISSLGEIKAKDVLTLNEFINLTNINGVRFIMQEEFNNLEKNNPIRKYARKIKLRKTQFSETSLAVDYKFEIGSIAVREDNIKKEYIICGKRKLVFPDGTTQNVLNSVKLTSSEIKKYMVESYTDYYFFKIEEIVNEKIYKLNIITDIYTFSKKDTYFNSLNSMRKFIYKDIDFGRKFLLNWSEDCVFYLLDNVF